MCIRDRANLQRGLASYDVLYFNMHGALYNDEPFICLEEKATLEKYVKTYSTDVKDGNVCLYGTFNSSGTQFMIRSSFFPAHYSRDTGNKLSAKWVHLGTCYGMSGSKSLSYDLSEAGAGCITGYSLSLIHI